jgi:hypothetical protein
MSEWHIGPAVAGLVLILGLQGCANPHKPTVVGAPPPSPSQAYQPPPPLLPDDNPTLPGYVPPPGTAVIQP